MPAPVTVLRTGTGWTVDVTSLQLSSDVGYKDIYVTVGGVADLLSNYTKTSASLLTYTGLALPPSTVVQVLRDSTRLVEDFMFSDVNTSVGLNNRFTAVERVMEDLRIFFSVVGTLTASLNLTGTSTGVTAATADNSTLVATTAYVKNNLATYATAASLSAYALNTSLANYATLAALASYLTTSGAAATYATIASLTSYAPLASPSLTGVPTAPTAALSTSNTQLATTQFVRRSSRPVCVLSRITSGQTFVAGTGVAAHVYNNKIRDTDGAYNSSTGVFTAPYTGFYQFTAYINMTQSSGGCSLNVHNSALSTILATLTFNAPTPTFTTITILSGSAVVFLTAADTVVFSSLAIGTNATSAFEPSTTARAGNHASIFYLGSDT